MKFLKKQFSKLLFLIATDAPAYVICNAFILNYKHFLLNYFTAKGKENIKKRNMFKNHVTRLQLDNDWFTKKIPTWLRAFDILNFCSKKELHCLEIGSWQGLSAYFLLNEFPHANLLCVDTWGGADEHKAGISTNDHILTNIEKCFDSNLTPFKDRAKKHKGTSFSFFAGTKTEELYDFVYVDGSHHSDDVIVDAIKGFELLKLGGCMIFDDYFWNHYKHVADNPASAINAFLRLRRRQIKIICFDSQLVITKLPGASRALKNAQI